MDGHRTETDVLDAVVTLVDSLLDDFDLVDLLTSLSERCADLLDVASAGLLLAGPGGELKLMAATSERTVELELFQLQRREGPCRDCYASGQPVSVADLREETRRWPDFVDAALGAGFTSVHAVPLRAADIVLGSLGLFGTAPGALSAADLTVARALTHVATVAIVQEHPPTPSLVLPRLFSALADRVVVEQAEGLLAQRLGIGLDAAFPLLRGFARARGTHLSALARTLMNDASARPAILAELTEFLDDSRA